MFGRLVDWILVVIGLVGLAITTWWALYAGPDRAAQLQDKLRDRAEAALANDGHDWARVEMQGQRAIISGQSPSHDSVEAARASVRRAVGRGGLLLGGVTRVADDVQAAKPISPYTWSARRTADGALQLTGYVPSRSVLDAMLLDAEAIAPGEVDNQLQIGSGEPFGDWPTVARKGLMQLDLLEQGEARLVDSALQINGRYTTPEGRDQVLSALAGIASPYSARSELQSVGLWRARHTPRGLVLTGSASSQAERNLINALANEHYPGAVRDEMTVRRHSHDGWTEGLQLALPHFAKFAAGELAFVPGQGGFRIEGEAPNSAISYLEEDLSALGSRWAVDLSVLESAPALAEINGINFGAADQGVACQRAFRSIMSENRITFDSGSARISRESGATLDKLLFVARQCTNVFVQVQGHTDSQGNRSGNIRLSEQRAAAVVDYLADRGVEKAQLDPVGFGPDRPIADNNSAEGRAANRRIEFTVVERG